MTHPIAVPPIAVPVAAQRVPRAPSALERLARRRLFERLEQLRWGRVTIRDAFGVHAFGPHGVAGAPSATLDVHDARFYLDATLNGSVGAGEAYMRADWSCDDLVALVRILVRNREVLQGLERGLARLGAAALRWFHARRDNTRDGSRANIAAHYDLGNDFYRLFLDESLMYSCALFEREDQTLHEAQVGRLERICRKLDLRPGEHLLEIGTGWGGMALHAAREHGCRVTTTTISREQFELARERVERAGLGERVTVLFEDYRDLRGHYDKLVSIEMIEAVGERWYDTYFAKCSELLAPHGLMLLQAITIRDAYYEQALRSVDFIQRHIFPGSCIPSLAAIGDRVARVTDLGVQHVEEFGPHYARTLREWRRRFFANLEQVEALGFDERFVRMWEFYLCYCEGGFEERSIGAVQMLLGKPENRRAPLIAPLA